MSEEFGNDFITIADDEGNEFELEVIDSLEHEGVLYLALLTADNEEPSDDDDGLIILKVIEEDGEEIFATPDSDEELNLIYNMFMERVFEAEMDEDGE
ncbi:MAG: DUF1292 domain-containing protein [Oscillospiraceae bacterium]|nr:DUF1292 domain-containing protein [Oscillospiraceae bacterium]